ncbi:MAG: DUF2255 family protein [Pseudomonadales bacterium]
MRLFLKILLAAVLLIGIVAAIQQYAAESGEVVVLQVADDQGATHETRLWIVDHDGSPWLRAGFAESGWYQRLLLAELISIERNGTRRVYVATPEPGAKAAIDQAMQDKYGWADSYIGKLFGGRDAAVPIRLRPHTG